MKVYNLTGLSRSRGAILRKLDKGDKLVFEFESSHKRFIHSVFCFYSLRVDCYEVDQERGLDRNRDRERLVESFELPRFSCHVSKPCNRVVETVI
jgi:hypothetical protein